MTIVGIWWLGPISCYCLLPVMNIHVTYVSTWNIWRYMTWVSNTVCYNWTRIDEIRQLNYYNMLRSDDQIAMIKPSIYDLKASLSSQIKSGSPFMTFLSPTMPMMFNSKHMKGLLTSTSRERLTRSAQHHLHHPLSPRQLSMPMTLAFSAMPVPVYDKGPRQWLQCH